MTQERDASEEEIILEFLKGHCGNPVALIPYIRRLLYDADLSDVEQNA